MFVRTTFNPENFASMKQVRIMAKPRQSYADKTDNIFIDILFNFIFNYLTDRFYNNHQNIQFSNLCPLMIARQEQEYG